MSGMTSACISAMSGLIAFGVANMVHDMFTLTVLVLAADADQAGCTAPGSAFAAPHDWCALITDWAPAVVRH